MKLVLLSGGSGKRLWPLSNDARSKQFLKVLKNEDGKLNSMVQRVWSQLVNVNLSESAVIATSNTQVEMIQSQLDSEKVSVVVEPERRDTFAAIALAATYLYSIKGVSLKEVIGVLPVDPYVDNQFFSKVKDLELTINNSDAEIALIGVEPTYPSSKYGYIVPENKDYNKDYLNVSHFTEKPSETKAIELLNQGALWNCGVFAFKLEYIITLLQKKGLPIQYESLLKQYDRLPKISFDYEVVEKAEKIVALPYEGYWKDLGTWNTLTEEMGTNLIGKGIIKDSTNTHLINELDIPVTVLGIPNAVVAVSPDGILVSDKEKSPNIKELVNRFEQRPMYEERRWGWYKVLDHTKFEDGQEVLTKRIGINKGANLSYQYHNHRNETWTIIKGEGVFVLNGEMKSIKIGDVLKIPVGAKHSIKAESDLEFIEVQTGNDLVEEDIKRIFITWEEIESHCLTLEETV
ncbi:sugar phosphate nucleotidyltransferase [Bacillus sp. PS06]|uniref:sugar phosphate nucleotidyltransferase n=1 Tax=Bacillus sp. PS06 TaxID=2764176 RepID=UPI00177EFC70|nr:sugar phosphate nucleotidyltransferase [Bacillus sp. PS06]MBD8069399.1 cupin domain-containing protein [Bacillus sp. PS06]